MATPTDPIFRYEARRMQREAPPVKPGMNVRVHVLIREGEKERVQPFEGMVVAVRGAGMSRTCTVRRMVRGIGVERIFPLHGSVIKEIEILGAQKVRRAKLSFLRKSNVKRRKREDSKVLERAQKAQEKQRHAEERAREEAEKQEKAEKQAPEETAQQDSQAPEAQKNSEEKK